jgi:hypothetical protein
MGGTQFIWRLGRVFTGVLNDFTLSLMCFVSSIRLKRIVAMLKCQATT